VNVDHEEAPMARFHSRRAALRARPRSLADQADRVEPMGLDGNGLLTERMWFGDTEVIVHYDDIPDGDITELDGIRLTTPLRTVIDIAPDETREGLAEIVADCLERRMFTVAEAWERIERPDMVDRPGAQLLRSVLPPCER
jgi:hypothetical protein